MARTTRSKRKSPGGAKEPPRKKKQEEKKKQEKNKEAEVEEKEEKGKEEQEPKIKEEQEVVVKEEQEEEKEEEDKKPAAKTAPKRKKVKVKQEEEDEKKNTPARSTPRGKKQNYKLDGEFESIRYGAYEIIAVYIGDDGAEEVDGVCNFGFVRLLDDVYFSGMVDEDEIAVEWFDWLKEEDIQKGKATLAPDMDDNDTYVAIGTLICAITDKVIETSDGSIEVTKEIHDFVKKKLEFQLSDEYDPTVEEETNYEERKTKHRQQQAKYIRKLKKTPKSSKRGRASGGGGDDESDSSPPKKKRKKADGKAAKASPARPRGLNPRPSVEIEKDIFTSNKTAKAGTFCGDTYRSSKEIIRAIRSGASTAFLKKLINDKKTVADLFVSQSVSVPLNAFQYAYAMENKEAAELLFEARGDNHSRGAFPDCTLTERTSGRHTSRYADYNRYKVAASRGGKEGNNAFMKERRNKYFADQMQILRDFFTEFDAMSVDFFRFIEKKIHNNQIFIWNFPLDDLLKSGHQELAALAMSAMVSKGVGLNTLHADVLGTSGTLKDKPRPISVTKKSADSGASTRFCPVHCAAINKSPKYLKQLLAIDPDAVNCLDSHEAGLLHYAAVSEGPETLQYLLESFTSLSRIQQTRKPKETPLMWAARASRPENVRLLCKDIPEEDLKKELKKCNVNGMTVLHMAVSTHRSGRYDTVRELIEAGANVDVRGDTRLMDKMTPSMLAARRGDLEMLELLVEKGASLRQTDKLGRTLAIWAAMNGHMHILSYLLKAGVDIDACDSSENTAIHYAAAYGWVECVELILKHGDADPGNSWSSTPLSLALKKGTYACAAVLLKLKDRVDVNVCDKTGRSLFSSLIGTYLSQLSREASTPIPWAIKQMLERDDLHVCAADTQKRTVLHYIAESPSASLPKIHDIVLDLFKRGLDPLKVDEKGDVAASLALRNGDLKFVKTLLDNASHSDVKISSSTSLLHLLIKRLEKGIQKGHDTADLFLELYDALGGSWTDVADEEGRKPLLLAADILRKTPRQSSDDQNWSWKKKIFEALVERMPSCVSDTLQPKADFSSWEKVEKRMIKNDEGKVKWWAPKDEYSVNASECCSIFHAMCSLRDVEWSLQMCQKLTKTIKDEKKLKELINMKSISGKTPIRLVIENFTETASAGSFVRAGGSDNIAWQYYMDVPMDGKQAGWHYYDKKASDGLEKEYSKGRTSWQIRSGYFSYEINLGDMTQRNTRTGTTRAIRRWNKNAQNTDMSMPLPKEVAGSPSLALLLLLCESGASLDGVIHPLFDSMEDALDSDVDMLDKLDVSSVSDDEKLERVRAHVIQRSRQGIRKKLLNKKNSDRDSFKATIQPLLHFLLKSHPSKRLLEALLPRMNKENKDLDENTALHVAVREGMEDAIRLILPCPALNSVNSQGDSPLTIAAEKGNLRLVSMLIEAGADLAYCSPRVGTALHIAVRGERATVAEHILSKATPSHVNAGDNEKRTPLHYAVALSAVSSKQELKPMEQQLLDAGAEVNVKDIHERAPLSYAFVPLTKDMKCDFPKQLGTRDPVEMLAMLRSVEGIQADYIDTEKRTIMHLAAGAGASISVLTLTEHYPELLNTVDMDGNTPLAVALLAKRWETALLLVSKGSSLEVDVTDMHRVRDKEKGIVEKLRSKRSALWHAVQSEGALSTYILSANRVSLDTVVSTLLLTGCFKKALQQIQQCRDKSVVCARNKDDGMNFLHRLAQAPSFVNAPGFDRALADAMIGAGISVTDTCNRGFSVAHIAAFHGHVKLMEYLLSQHGATVDVEDHKGGTPVSSLFSGTSLSETMLCMFLEASKNSSKIASSAVDAFRSRKSDEALRSQIAPEAQMFDTAQSKRRSKKEFLARLAKAKDNSKQSKQKKAAADDYTVSSTVLIEAVRRQNVRITNALLSFGADPNGRDGEGRTALHHAAISSRVDLLSLLLRCSVESIDATDKHGFTPLVYTVLKGMQKPKPAKIDEALAVLLDYGADPQAGNALEIAVRNNHIECAQTMMQCSKIFLKTSETNYINGGEPFASGGNVWVRFAGMRGTWQLSTVVGVSGEMLSVVPGKVDIKTLSEREKRYIATERVHRSWVRSIDTDKDAPYPAEELYSKYQKTTGVIFSEADRKKQIARYAGRESALLEKLDGSEPSVQCVLGTKLKVGDIAALFVQSGVSLAIGKVVNVHPNGLYDFQLLRGKLHKQISRSQLRTVRQELKLECLNEEKKLSPALVHVCVRPVEFGSYENMDMLQALSDFGAPLDGKDAEGRTPLEVARPGSEIQKFLQEATKKPGAGRQLETVSVNLPSLDGIDLVRDADAALKKLHDDGADATERIVPKVSDVCDLESEGVHVLKEMGGEDDRYYDVSLTKVDVEHGRYGKYVFYKMQVVHDPIQKLYVLLTNWGRIGETGKYQQTPYSSKEECVKEFGKVFKSKSGNVWGEPFEKKPKKYSLVDTRKTRVKHPEKLLSAIVEKQSTPCQLGSSLSDTLRCLLDVDTLMSAVKRSGLDQSQLPLGQLSLDTLDKAEAKLREIKKRLDEPPGNDADATVIQSALESVAKLTSEYYELIPIGDQIVQPFQKNDHRFGEAVELIRKLRDLNVTKQLLLGALHHQEKLNPLEYAYNALQMHMEPLEVGAKERDAVERYIDSTCTDDVVVHQIYKLDNGQESCNDIGNKRLLFHGSKNFNVLAILKQGLRIAPPEAPTTGYMYGKGVYFADRFSKAFGYTSGLSYSASRRGQSQQQPRAYVFLAEVAIGTPHVAFGAEYMEEPREGTHSTYAIGSKAPNKTLDVVMDNTGVTVPLGALEKSTLPDVAQFKWERSRMYYSPDSFAVESRKIEKVRTDPSTTFPTKVAVTIDNAKKEMLLESPFADIATEVIQEKKEKEKKKEKSAKKEQPDGATSLFDDSDDDSDDDMNAFQTTNFQTNNTNAITLNRTSQSSLRSMSEYSEFIVYDTKQIRLKYMIELTSPAWLEKEFNRQQKGGGDENNEDDGNEDDDDDDDDYNPFNRRRPPPEELFDDSDDDDDY